MKPILEIQNLSKKYQLQHMAGGYLSLRERMVNTLKFNKDQTEDFWALKDVSFEVQAGESIGIIGRNGAGKSTLLKILSKITPPTTGRIISRGRIASLLEVGTGFHPELTGRENIFFNGSLLGMKRMEIAAKFDEIVDFSGVEKFLDTPLKHYSSGMQLRLAFAVAAFLEPEILIIDEVLAVGDAEFQKKCLGKMEDVSKSGRTILFVSHNIDAVESLCKTCLLLYEGKLIAKGQSKKIISQYIHAIEQFDEFKPIVLGQSLELSKLSIHSPIIFSGSALVFTITLSKLRKSIPALTHLCLLFYNYKRQRVAIYDLRHFFKDFKYTDEKINYDGIIKSLNLVEGTYYLGLYYGMGEIHNDLYDLAKIIVRSANDISGIKPYELQHRGFVELI